MDFSYNLIRSKRKTLTIQVKNSCDIVVRAPLKMPERDINAFIIKNESWIKKQLLKFDRHRELYPEPSEDEIKRLKKLAKEIIPKKVSYYSTMMGLTPTSVKITSAKTRFGSCSGKNALCFSYRLMMYPDEAVDYVVVHELAHIKHHNHSKNFYGLIKEFMPDYKERANLLKRK